MDCSANSAPVLRAVTTMSVAASGTFEWQVRGVSLLPKDKSTISPVFNIAGNDWLISLQWRPHFLACNLINKDEHSVCARIQLKVANHCTELHTYSSDGSLEIHPGASHCCGGTDGVDQSWFSECCEDKMVVTCQIAVVQADHSRVDARRAVQNPASRSDKFAELFGSSQHRFAFRHA